MPGTEPVDVLVVGAGPVGLTLALALAHQGVSVRILDKNPTFSGASKAVTLMPRILELYSLLGVARAMVEAGVPSDAMQVHVGRNHVMTWRYDRLESPFPFYLHLHQGHTETLLAEALEARGVAVERGATLVDYREEPDRVVARFARSDGRIDEVAGRFLAGCDGGHSTVRTLTGTTFHQKQHPDNWIMTDVRIPDMSLDPTQRHGFLLDRRPFVVLPLGDGYFRLISARLPDDPNVGRDPTLEDFHQLVGDLGLGPWTLDSPRWLTNYRPRQCLVDDYRKGRAFLVGDAAHLNSPIAAQGLNTGAMDAFNLAWKLQMVLAGQADGTLLDTYQEERQPAARAMFAENDKLTRMVYGERAAIRKLARGRLQLFRLPRANLGNVLRTSQIGLSYRGSSLLGPSGGWFAPVRAGDRLPAARLNVHQTLLDTVRADRHTLCLFDAGCPVEALDGLAHVAQTELSDLLALQWVLSPSCREAGFGRACVYDASGHAHRALGVSRPAAVLVRPDGYIGAFFTPRDGRALRAYFHRIQGRADGVSRVRGLERRPPTAPSRPAR